MVNIQGWGTQEGDLSISFVWSLLRNLAVETTDQEKRFYIFVFERR